ncbi:MAG: PDZ domain-containing protein [Synergistaceae bacterium]|nr:PDZ domain-containing protein [Synergistaceae bacterium]
MKRTFLLMTLLIVVLCAIPAEADTTYYYVPTVYVDPDPTWVLHDELVKIVSMVLPFEYQPTPPIAAQERYRQMRIDADNHLSNLVNETLRRSIKELNNDGLQEYLKTLKKSCIEKGLYYTTDQIDNIYSLTYVDDIHEDLITRITYIFDTKMHTCSVRMSIPNFRFSRIETASYVEPRPKTLIPRIEQYLGLKLLDYKIEIYNKYGVEVLGVEPNGIAEKAGLRAQDIIVKIDSYDLTEYSIERMASYIYLRAEQHAVVRIRFFRGTTQKITHLSL